MTPRGRRRLAAVLMAAGAACLGSAAWIHVKAFAAQALLRAAWSATREDARAHRPWPWADTHPVARLDVPSLDVDLVVLDGFSGEALAFGPGMRTGPNGVPVLSGHRDTHFRFVPRLAPGDTLGLQGVDGTRREYRVRASAVFDYRDPGALAAAGGDDLVLVTCWPPDAIDAGGPARLVVYSHAVATARNTAASR